ncbi:MAG: hypothetical protein HRF50_01870 [Phycisphaerae bacterium]|jgi:hypothetical protein
MSTAGGFGFPGGDPFTAFWSEMWSKLGAGGAAAPQPQPEVFERMRKAFFDAMAQQAEQFLRSETFLKAMKQAMDNALGVQQMMNESLRKGLSAAQAPTRADADHVSQLVRDAEERILDRLDALDRRVERLERPAAPRSGGRRRSASAASTARKTKKN